MALSHGRVVKVGETLYPREQEGIAFAIGALPDIDPYHLWALVDLMDPSTGRLLAHAFVPRTRSYRGSSARVRAARVRTEVRLGCLLQRFASVPVL